MEYYWETQGYYGKEYGWEMVTTDNTKSEALNSVKVYRDNEPQYRFRVRRIALGEG